MNYDTLHQALEASTIEANKQGLSIKIPMITGGISYGQNRRFSFEAYNPKRPNSKKAWQVVITRMDNGTYELVNYYL